MQGELRLSLIHICLGDGVIYADAGVPLSKLCAFALSKNLSGLEFAYGIPGTAGGAAYTWTTRTPFALPTERALRTSGMRSRF